jgi:hypothetical protein
VARREGVALDIVFSENFAAQQAHDIMRFLHANGDQRLGLIVQTVGDIAQIDGTPLSAQPVYRLALRAAAKGAGWIVLNREADAQVAALRKDFPSLPIGIVTPDQKELGRVQGRQFKALLPRGGRLLYVLGIPSTSSAQDRRAGMLEAIRGGAIEVGEVTAYGRLTRRAKPSSRGCICCACPAPGFRT